MFLKRLTRRLPLPFRGELRDVELVQLSLDPEEARDILPSGLRPRLLRGRALVSVASLELAAMRPAFLPPPPGPAARHVALRMLVDDSALNADGRPRGIHFFRSFTDSRVMLLGSDWFSRYELRRATVERGREGTRVESEGRTLAYSRGGAPELRGATFRDLTEALHTLAPLDRCYQPDDSGALWRTRVRRAEWPLEPLGVNELQTDLFATARLECALRVVRPVVYTWLAPERMPRAERGVSHRAA